MDSRKEGELVSFDLVSPGWEAEYVGINDLSLVESNEYLSYSVDNEGFVLGRYSLWGFAHLREEDWNDEIRYINAMQTQLGFLDENTRRIRRHIASLVCCDSGVPVTIDEILNTIGTGRLPEPLFHTGCWIGGGMRSTQPCHLESMKLIEDVLKGYLDGKSKEEFIVKYPHAKGFIGRTYKWLKPIEKLTKLQRLMIDRMLLPFDYFTMRNEDITALDNNLIVEGSRLDMQISKLAGLPKIYPINNEEYKDRLNTISDPANREIYKICGNISFGIHGIADCHHNVFRIIEKWIHGIGTLRWNIPTRIKSSERNRLGRLLFAYALGLDRWLQNIPHQFLLLDLGHIDLGFDPKNEILRVYAYLGDKRTPINKWLAACMWYKLTLDPSAGLYNWGNSHNELIQNAKRNGIDVSEWMNSVLETSPNGSNI